MAEPTVRKIIHVDMDAFFASVEQRDDQTLRGKPVAVGYPAARGVVAAASYEAREFGVRSALPSVTATRRCPDLIFVPPRFDVYRAMSRQIRDIFAEFTTLVQPLSLDEAYLDVTDNLQGIATAWETAKLIRARILAKTGLTASAGISYNKFLAKLASDQRNRMASSPSRPIWRLNGSRRCRWRGSTALGRSPPRSRRSLISSCRMQSRRHRGQGSRRIPPGHGAHACSPPFEQRHSS